MSPLRVPVVHSPRYKKACWGVIAVASFVAFFIILLTAAKGDSDRGWKPILIPVLDIALVLLILRIDFKKQPIRRTIWEILLRIPLFFAFFVAIDKSHHCGDDYVSACAWEIVLCVVLYSTEIFYHPQSLYGLSHSQKVDTLCSRLAHIVKRDILYVLHIKQLYYKCVLFVIALLLLCVAERLL